jgi:membrane-associated protease RseP (regulator of RpoE activity)
MYKQKTWKRVAVLFAGPAMNFIIGLVLIYAIAVGAGPAVRCVRRRPPSSVRRRASEPEVDQGRTGHLCGSGPGGAQPGFSAGDVDRQGRRDDRSTTFEEMVKAVQKSSRPDRRSSSNAPGTATPATSSSSIVDVTTTQRWVDPVPDGGEAHRPV